MSNYVCNKSAPVIDTAYMLLEYIQPETGEPLMYTSAEHMNDSDKQKRLYKGMTRIMLSLAKLPQPHIGSFRFDPDDATVSLCARPLTCTIMLFEHGDTPRTIPSSRVYNNTDSFVSDMLTMYDTQLLHNPHAAGDANDAKERMAMRAMIRSVAHQYIAPELRNCPFLLQLTDFHQSNIMVDKDWNVTCLIDLEWISALPAESLSVPYWLTGCSIDTIIDDAYPVFDEARKLSLQTMEENGKHIHPKHNIHFTDVMQRSWDSKAVWFWACLRSIDGWLLVLESNILPKYTSNTSFVADLKNLSAIWHENIDKVVERKVADEEKYQEALKELFLRQKSAS